MLQIQTSEGLAEQLKSVPIFVVIFTNPEPMVPEQSLLSYFRSIESARQSQVQDKIFLFRQSDQKCYDMFNLKHLPCSCLIKDSKVLSCFVGYNREKTAQMVEILRRQIGIPEYHEQIDITRKCPRDFNRLSIVGEGKVGLFFCSVCKMMSHSQTGKLHLQCGKCGLRLCHDCSVI